jgi:alpha-glucosidase
MKAIVSGIAVVALWTAPFSVSAAPSEKSAAGELVVKMLPGEKWWGLCDNFGREMPFSEKTEFRCDLRRDNYLHQSLSFLCSDKGRALWCQSPVGAEISGGEIRLRSGKAGIVFEEKAGGNLAEAFRYASKTWFPPSGGTPDLLYFSAPQYNTWIELTYNQNEKDILAYAESMIVNGMPPGIFMIDDTWQHGYGEWYFDMRRFSDPKGMVDRLHAMGFKVLLWVCPFVSMDTPAYRRVAWGINPNDVRGYPAKGGFVSSSRIPKRSGVPPPAGVGWWNGTSAMLDFTHPNAVAWFTEQLDRLIRDYGVDGFKLDGGEVQFYGSGDTPPFAHDPAVGAPEQSALYASFALRYRSSECRNAYGLAGKPIIMRLHDKEHSWEALRRLVPDMIAAGFVGCPFICPDMIGGGSWTAFLPGSPFDPELFIRSAQVHALCPMMQISASPWRVLQPGHQRIFKKTVELRQRFAPRFAALAEKSAVTGEPIMRNMEYCFPGMGYAEIKDQFMMGDGLLVAPVLRKGACSRKVVLPPGRWKADDGKIHEGAAAVEVAAPLERLPYFERM